MIITNETPLEAARRLMASKYKDGYEADALHTYTDTIGNDLYWRIRLNHATHGKMIRPMALINGTYVLKEPPFNHGEKPLYNLHQLAINTDNTVFICEGEKCADALNKLGLLATTSGGVDSIRKTNFDILKTRDLIIWHDNDIAGIKWQEDLISILLPMQCKIQCIDVQALNLSAKGDCVDWLADFKQVNSRNAISSDIFNLPMIEGLIQTPTSDYLVARDTSLSAAQNNQPEPLPELPNVLPFDYDYLPPVLRGYVRDISERMQCPPDFAAVGALVMVATIIGRRVAIRPKQYDNWTVIPNLWGAVVGNSGVMKSPALADAIKPLNKLVKKANASYESAKADYGASAEIAKLQVSVNKVKAKKALSKDDTADVRGLLKAGADADMPLLKRYKTNNASYEALGELLIENPNGILVESDEIIGLLKQLDASGQEVARSFYLTAADGDKSYTFDRIMRGKGLHIEALCLSIIGGIQPGVLAEYVRQAVGGGAGADGLLQRFGLAVYPDIAIECKYVDKYPDNEIKQSINELVNWLDTFTAYEIEADEEDLYNNVPFLHFDNEAQLTFADWLVDIDTRLRSGDEHPAIVSHLSKYRKLIPALSLINHLCDKSKGAVGKASLLRAIAFSEYLESHAKRIYSFATRPDVDAARTLLKRLQSKKLDSPFTTRDVYRVHWTGLETTAKAQSAIDLLLEYKHLNEETINTNGRPSTFYHWHGEAK